MIRGIRVYVGYVGYVGYMGYEDTGIHRIQGYRGYKDTWIGGTRICGTQGYMG